MKTLIPLVTLAAAFSLQAAPEIAVDQLQTHLTSGQSESRFTGAGAVKAFTIRNEGTEPLTGLSLSISGDNAGSFIAGLLESTHLPAGHSLTFHVTFLAIAPGIRQSTLSIASNDADENPFTIALGGTHHGTYSWENLAGSTSYPGVPGTSDGTKSEARFFSPGGVACDATGTLFVADTANHTIRKIYPGGSAITFAGQAGVPGSANGTGSAATFNQPSGIAIDKAGNLYVTDSTAGLVRKIIRSGGVTTLAYGLSDPRAIAVDAEGLIYVANTGDHTIRRITPAGTVSIFAGSPNTPGYTDGTFGQARFRNPAGIAIDSNGVILIADTGNHTIRRIFQNAVTTLAGKPGGKGEFADGGATARFNSPRGMAVDASGNLFVADEYNHRIRVILPSGDLATLGGNGTLGNLGGLGTAARFHRPAAVALTPDGRLFVAGGANHNIVFGRLTAPEPGAVAMENAVTKSYLRAGSTEEFHRVTKESSVARVITIRNSGNQTLTGLAVDILSDNSKDFTKTKLPTSLPPGGSADLTITFQPTKYGPQEAQLRITTGSVAAPFVIRLSGSGVPAVLWSGLAGSGTEPPVPGTGDGTGHASRFQNPNGIAVDSGGNLFIADTGNHIIRKIAPGGVVTTFAGQAGTPGNADGVGGEARFNSPDSLAFGPGGILYVADRSNHRIRRIAPDGTVTTYASPKSPVGLAVSESGIVYTSSGDIIMKIGPDRVARIFAGNLRGSTDGAGTAARFFIPRGLALDRSGNLHVADTGNRKIRKINPAGQVSTFAGSGLSGSTNGQGTSARFANPVGVGIDAAGDLLVTDSNRIRKISPSGDVTTTGGSLYGNREGIGTVARFSTPTGIAADSNGTIFLAGNNNHNIMSGTPLSTAADIAVLPVGNMSLSNGGAVRLGEAPGIRVSLTFAIRNYGQATLENLSISLAGESAGDFSIQSADVATQLVTGGETTFGITFTPSAPGPRPATISLVSNDPDENPFVIELSGSGLNPREKWRLGHFTHWENSGIAADLADPDHDGLQNLLEFAFNLDPGVPGVPVISPGNGIHGLPSIRTTPDPGSKRLRIEYIRLKNPAVNGIVYQPQFSSTLESGSPDGWIDAAGPETVSDIDGIWERVIVEDTASDNATRFGRVKLSGL